MEKHEIEALIREIEDETAELGVYPAPVPALNPDTMAKYIDHTYLKPEATVDDIRRICAEAREMGTASVCVNPSYIRLVAEELRGTDVTPCCVIGFPLGATTPDVKAFEAEGAVMDGAREVDMVINVGAAKSGDWKLVRRDIEAVVDAVAGEALVKVIIETCLLTDEEKVKACAAAKLAGAAFVKTSTGFSTGGAKVEDVRLMRQTVGPEMGVKASGGVRTYEDAVAMIEAGASRLGASAGKKIIEGARAAAK
jgi:deoxyribose-phosphate aldolase